MVKDINQDLVVGDDLNDRDPILNGVVHTIDQHENENYTWT